MKTNPWKSAFQSWKDYAFVIGFLFFWLLFAIAIASAEPICKSRTPKASRPWRSEGFLWKPLGEHTGKPTILFFNNFPSYVALVTREKKTIRRLPRWSLGNLGAIYRESTRAKELKQKYGVFFVRAKYSRACIDWRVADATQRSDGK